jgi:DNA modification methylase
LKVQLHNGECIEVMRSMPDNSVDAVVTDPPYGLSFMGKKWDYDVPSEEVWRECLRVLKPGGHLLAFAGTRTQHRMACRIEDAGFEIRDMIAWVYGSGFPKSLDVSKAIDKMDATEARRDRQLRFTEWVRGTGLTAVRIDGITGTNMGGHYTTAASQPAVATREHFETLRPHFGCAVPEWVERLVDERTVESENFKRRDVVGTHEKLESWDYAGNNVFQTGGSAGRVTIVETVAHTNAARQWAGWGTALKPALEPITMARKPFTSSVAANVVEHGTGAINVDGCRVAWSGVEDAAAAATGAACFAKTLASGKARQSVSIGKESRDGTEVYDPMSLSGRWPANLIHDDGDEVQQVLGDASRFFYCAKASKSDREEGLEEMPEVHRVNGNKLTDQDYLVINGERPETAESGPRKNIHPTVKPTDLMRYLCRLVTQPGGVVLDPFMGSGSTGKAAVLEGFRFVGIERDETYFEIAKRRILNTEAKQEPSSKQGELW